MDTGDRTATADAEDPPGEGGYAATCAGNDPGPAGEADPDFDPLLAFAAAHPLGDAGGAAGGDGRPGWAGEVIALLAQIRDAGRAARPAFYTTAEFARRCGVTAGTVRRWIRTTKVRAVKRWRADQAHLLIPASELDRLLVVNRGLGPGEYDDDPGLNPA